MSLSTYKPSDPITGESLKRRLSEKIVHQVIADSFIYHDSTLMISSQPGIGKSVLAIQQVLQLASGLPLFGALHVPRPMKVWYIQMERSDIESLERIQFMSDHIPINYENIFIDTELQTFNFLKDNDFEYILERGLLIKPDVTYIDPLYGIATGLSKDEIGSEVAKRLTVLKRVLNCAIIVNHHNVKPTYTIKGERINKEDPFYGAQWLKAHATGSYLLGKTDEGVIMEKRKDSHSNLLDKIELVFDHDTYISTMKSSELDHVERYKLFINSKFRSKNQEFYFEEARANLGCVISTLRKLNSTPLFLQSLITVKANGRKTLYRVVKEVSGGV